jgi:hypothetical protein
MSQFGAESDRTLAAYSISSAARARPIWGWEPPQGGHVGQAKNPELGLTHTIP